MTLLPHQFVIQNQHFNYKYSLTVIVSTAMLCLTTSQHLLALASSNVLTGVTDPALSTKWQHCTGSSVITIISTIHHQLALFSTSQHYGYGTSDDKCGVGVLTCAAALSRVPAWTLAWAGQAPHHLQPPRPNIAATRPPASPQLLLTLTPGGILNSDMDTVMSTQ